MKLSEKIAADMLGKRTSKEFLGVYEKYAVVCSYDNFWKICIGLGLILPKHLNNLKYSANFATPQKTSFDTAVEYARKRREFNFSDFRDYLYDRTGFFTKSAASKALGKLIELGHIERVKNGLYRSMAA